jgi:hypothetical protein
MTKRSRIDLHVHTCHSKTAGDVFLNGLGVHESYTRPESVYRAAKARGMDFVTITDHDSISGALEIAHLDHVIVGEEITTYFPDDGACLHVVALDIDESHHRDIQKYRHNIFELVSYLQTESLYHFVAHPFFRMTTLSLEHVEQCLLLFETFEVRNGGKTLYPVDLIDQILDSLTPITIESLSSRYGIEPYGEDPWIKNRVSGSDDHGGILIGVNHTSTPLAASKGHLMTFLKSGQSQPEGDGGTPLAVGAEILSVTAQCAIERKWINSSMKSRAIGNLLGPVPAGKTLMDRLLSGCLRMNGSLLSRVLRGRKEDLLTDVLFEHLYSDPFLRNAIADGVSYDDKQLETLFKSMSGIAADLIDRMMEAGQGEGIERLKSLSLEYKTLLATAILIVPYLVAFRTEYKDRPLMRNVYRDYHVDAPPTIAVFTDEPDRAHLHVKELTELQRTHVLLIDESRFQMSPQTPSRWLFMIMECLDLFFIHDVTQVYIHSIGKMGLLGLFVARWMNVSLVLRYPAMKLEAYLDALDKKEARIYRFFFKNLLRLVDEIWVEGTLDRQHAQSLGAQSESIQSVPELWASMIVHMHDDLQSSEKTLPVEEKMIY